MKGIRYVLPTVLIIVIFILSIMLYQKTQELKNIKIRSYLEFTNAADEVSVLIGEDASKERIHESLLDLEASYYHNIARFHRMNLRNADFFDDVENFVEEQDDIDWDLFNEYIASMDGEIGEFIRKSGSVSDTEMDQFIATWREEFNEKFIDGELQN
ncbi:hypothetical protein GCM10011351_29430 [Paraliobacillus quinghaiensis]|uniref:Uncharacterized protein n=1 Tax=Paraliobacillus quinghaiensis TaxID=470815 RepID=A0A917TWF7_9BACI|nr:hypothetical protein [Paraliobacillus quinghaiensis]GGM41365.1 hypothetical protein GCM10011351_29430 [Paraliobacillus quinghaiensis]